MKLDIFHEGATAETRATGLSAAERHLVDAGVQVLPRAAGTQGLGFWDRLHFEESQANRTRAAAALDAAEEAANREMRLPPGHERAWVSLVMDDRAPAIRD